MPVRQQRCGLSGLSYIPSYTDKAMSQRIFPITMPKWGIEMQQGTITQWHAEPGQALAKGDTLLDVETEKIVNSVEAPIAGTLRRILADVGATESVGVLIAVFAAADVPDAEVDAFIAGFKPADTSFEPDGGEPVTSSAPAPATTESSDGDGQGQPDRPAAGRQARHRRHQDQGHGQPWSRLEGRCRSLCRSTRRQRPCSGCRVSSPGRRDRRVPLQCVNA